MARMNPEFINDTPAHEVAHHIVRDVYGKFHNGRKVQPHGAEWKYVMRHVMGQNPDRCHSMDYKPARKTKKYAHECQCSIHYVGAKVHGKINDGAIYTCRKCKAKLI